jgi:hypothetical protein
MGGEMLKSKSVFRLVFQTVCIPLIVPTTILLSIASESKSLDAFDASMKWLDLVDNGKYQESYNQSSAYFRSVVLKKDWVRMIDAVRDPLGKVISRNFKSSQYTNSLPGAPDGEYVVIQFDTSFVNKKTAIETVTPMKDDDGQWRVSGYYIK